MKSLSAIAWLALSFVSARAADSFSFHHENVLGTSLELRIHADSSAAAENAEASVLAEIDRLSKILSTWSGDSEISRWQHSAGRAVPVSAELFAVLKSCDEWAQRSNGVFNPRTAQIAALWKTGEIPATGSLRPATEAIASPAWRLDTAKGTAAYLASPGAITVDALAKGYMIDRALEKAAVVDGVSGMTLNIGGDLRSTGEVEETIAIADPHHAEENALPATTVRLRNQALATSGDYRRGWTISGRHYSHIIDPRSGQPAGHVASASVIAPDATTADALATIFNILRPEESLAMADGLPDVSCLIIGADGSRHASRSWSSFTGAVVSIQAETPAKPMELKIDFELNKPEAERYLRPYVAVWIEDQEGYPVRTLSLWILKGKKGLNWLPDLKRWTRSDKNRRLAGEENIVPIVSSATRNPGAYSLVWDGLDDGGQPVPAGEYTVFIEAAREKGTYQLIKHPFKLGEPFTIELEGNVEVKSASLDYHAKTAAD